MGAVYEVVDAVDENQVLAVKLLAPELFDDPRALRRLEREVQCARSLEHPNVIRVFGEYEDARFIGYAMEYLDGDTLEAHLAGAVQQSPFAGEPSAARLSQISQVAEQLAAALDHIHARELVHRDVKPSNVMLCPPSAAEGAPYTVKLLDFGIVHAPDRTRYTQTEQPGTLKYMAPELVDSSAPPTPVSDVYSYAKVVYRLLTGGLPGRPPAPPTSVDPDYTRRLDRVLVAALSDAPGNRPESVGRIAIELRRAAERREARTKGATAPTDPAKDLSGADYAMGVVGLLKRDTGYEMVRVDPGGFVMGSPVGEEGRYDNERQHRVTLSEGFYLGKTPVTQRLWV